MEAYMSEGLIGAEGIVLICDSVDEGDFLFVKFLILAFPKKTTGRN